MAQITLTIPDEHIPRLRAAVAERLQMDEGDVTLAIAKDHLIFLVKSFVQDHEREKARDAIAKTINTVDIT